jgi:uncharacterized sulfatase
VDLYPTLAERAGLAPPAGLDGRSLRPLLDDPTASWDSQALTQILRPADSRFAQTVMGRSVRTERWRYTEWNEGRDGLELYDHTNDPQEFRNLATDPAHAAVASELRTRFGSRARGTAPASNVNPARL